MQRKSCGKKDQAHIAIIVQSYDVLACQKKSNVGQRVSLHLSAISRF